MSGAIPVIIEKRGMAYMKKTKTRALSEKSRPAKKKKNQAFRTYVVQKMRLIEYIVVLWLHHVDILLKASIPNFIELYLIYDKNFDDFFCWLISSFENWNVVNTEVGVGSLLLWFFIIKQSIVNKKHFYSSFSFVILMVFYKW